MRAGLHKQSGLSLIELMIALVVGAILMVAVTRVFLHSSASSVLIETESRLQDDAQFVRDTMNRTIRLAGYVTDPVGGFMDIGIDTDISLINDPAPPPEFVSGYVVNGIDGSNTEPDAIVVWYQGNDDGGVSDCLGNSIAGGELVSIRYQLNQNARTMECIVHRYEGENNSILIEAYDPVTVIGGDSTSQVLDLQFLYGIDTDSDRSVNLYKPFSLISDTELLDILAVDIKFTLQGNVNQDVLRKKYSSTIYLRNRIKDNV